MDASFELGLYLDYALFLKVFAFLQRNNHKDEYPAREFPVWAHWCSFTNTEESGTVGVPGTVNLKLLIDMDALSLERLPTGPVGNETDHGFKENQKQRIKETRRNIREYEQFKKMIGML